MQTQFAEVSKGREALLRVLGRAQQEKNTRKRNKYIQKEHFH